VQDFVKSGKWSHVNDIENTDLAHRGDLQYHIEDNKVLPGVAPEVGLAALDRAKAANALPEYMTHPEATEALSKFLPSPEEQAQISADLVDLYEEHMTRIKKNNPGMAEGGAVADLKGMEAPENYYDSNPRSKTGIEMLDSALDPFYAVGAGLDAQFLPSTARYKDAAGSEHSYTAPGIVQSLIGMGALPSAFGGPEIPMSTAAGTAYNEGLARTLAHYGLPDEEHMTRSQHVGKTLGELLGQIPLGAEKLAVEGLPIAKKVLMAIPEYLGPTIHPSAANYAFGTAGGEAFPHVLRALQELDEKYPGADLQGMLDQLQSPTSRINHMTDPGIRELISKHRAESQGYAGGGAIVEAAARAAERAPSKIADLKEFVRQHKGEYGARRVERAADEIPNLASQYSDEALRRAFVGDNTQLLMTMHPDDFEEYAARLNPDYDTRYSIRGSQSKLGYDDYINYLGNIARGNGLEDVPYLNLGQRRVWESPEITGHEGRHRTRALTNMGDDSTLIRLYPQGDLREDFPRTNQEQYIESFRNFMSEHPTVKPETENRSRLALPEFYAKGGLIDLAQKYAGGGAVVKAAAEAAARAAEKSAGKGVKTAAEELADLGTYYHGTDKNILDSAGNLNFKTGQRGAVFLTPDPSFADKYALNDTQLLPDDIDRMVKQGAPAPEGASVYPVTSNVSKPFDINNKDHLAQLKSVVTVGGAQKARWKPTQEFIEQQIREENPWVAVERLLPDIKKAGFDSAFIEEMGRRNLAVFDPKNVESTLSNKGVKTAAQDMLDMSQGARMARAAEQGYTEPLYHGTADIENEGFDEFNKKFYGSVTNSPSAKMGTWLTDNPETANIYASFAPFSTFQGLQDTYQSTAKKLRRKSGMLEGEARTAAREKDKLKLAPLADKIKQATEALEAGVPDPAEARKFFPLPTRIGGGGGANIMPVRARGNFMEYDAANTSIRELRDKKGLTKLAKEAREGGYDGLKITNFSDPLSAPHATHYLVFDTKNIRSEYAGYDPSKLESSDLGHAKGGSVHGYAAGGLAELVQKYARGGAFVKAAAEAAARAAERAPSKVPLNTFLPSAEDVPENLYGAADRAAAGRKAAELIKSQELIKASEALGQAMEQGFTKTATTQADRTRVGGGNIGGAAFSALSEADPEYAGKVWGVMDPGTASRLTNLTTPETAWTTMLGSATQLKTNPVVFDKLQRAFKKSMKEGNLSPELADKINYNLALTFGEGADIRDPSIWNQADTFEKRAALADVMMGQGVTPKKGGVALGGEKSGRGVIFKPTDILMRETEPGLLHPEHGGDVPTFAAGPRLFSMNTDVQYRPDLHPGFPTLIGGEDLGVNMMPTPTEVYLPDWHSRFKANNPDRNPGYYDLSLGVKGEGLPSQDLNDDYIRHLIREGFSHGGAVEFQNLYNKYIG
jgi:hypothetical protein